MPCWVLCGFAAALILLLAPPQRPAQAQRLGTAAGPDVQAGDLSAEARGGIAPDNGAATVRLHLQRAFNERVRLRGIVFGRDRGRDRDAFGFSYGEAQLLLQTTESGGTGGYAAAVRLDARYRNGGAPHQFGLNWLHELTFGARWRARTGVYLNRDIGENPPGGITFETRSSVSRRLPDGLRLHLTLIDDFGRSTRFGGFHDQQHQLGPTLSGRLGQGWDWAVRGLFGLSRQANDVEFSLRLDYAF